MSKREQNHCDRTVPRISVILPVLNEAENLVRIIPLLEKTLNETGRSYEIIVVDDDSNDGTEAVLAGLSAQRAVSGTFAVIKRRWKVGLSSAVVDGFNAARGSVFGVLDADLSHDIAIIPDLIRALDRDDAAMAIGSRYIKGGGIDDTWPLKRRIISKTASLMARPITKVRDPLSGFFFFKKELLNGVKLKTTGFKICLEILVKARCRQYAEIPYTFTDRKVGEKQIKDTCDFRIFDPAV